jgi:hypothetical protein
MHVEHLIDTVSALNWQAVVGIFVVVWFFTRDLRKSIDGLKEGQNILLAEVKSIHSDLKVMNTRISRIEGTVYGEKLYKTLGEET